RGPAYGSAVSVARCIPDTCPQGREWPGFGTLRAALEYHCRRPPWTCVLAPSWDTVQSAVQTAASVSATGYVRLDLATAPEWEWSLARCAGACRSSDTCCRDLDVSAGYPSPAGAW